MRRRALLIPLAAVAAGAPAVHYARAEAPPTPVVRAAAPVAPAPTATPVPPPPELPPLPDMRPTVVEPEAGGGDAAPAPAADDAEPRRERAPRPAAPEPRRGAGTEQADQALTRAIAVGDGIALPPLEAPDAVKQIIEAGNVIARSPYKWGGGHGRWQDSGYDCSGSVSFALAAAGLLDASLTSGQLMSWGQAGEGEWVTLYANDGHVFMEVAGLRFDTSGRQITGSRWQNEMRSADGFVARHPPGL